VHVAFPLQPPLLLPQWTTAARRRTCWLEVVEQRDASDACSWCSTRHVHRLLPLASQAQRSSRGHHAWAEQACCQHPLTCASLTVASEACLACALAGATDEAAVSITAAASVVAVAWVHTCQGAVHRHRTRWHATRRFAPMSSMLGLSTNRSALGPWIFPSASQKCMQHVIRECMCSQQACCKRPLTGANIAIASEARIAGACVALRDVGAGGLATAASVFVAAMDHS